jgi:hypothetical protein
MSFCRGSNFRALAARADLPEVLQKLRQSLRKTFDSDRRGTLVNDALALHAPVDETSEPFVKEGETETKLPDVTYASLINRLRLDQYASSHGDPSPFCVMRSSLSLNGVTFATPKRRRPTGDSLLLFRKGNQRRCGQIKEIFVHHSPSPNGDIMPRVFLAVQPFRELSAKEAESDPYRRFPLLDVRLCHDQFDDLEVIQSSDIISHFASCPYRINETTQYRVVLSLDRVSRLFFLCFSR